MVFHNGGRFTSEEELERKGKLRDDATPFREPGQTVFALIANGGCLLLVAIMLAGIWFIGRPGLKSFGIQMGIASVLSLAFMIPHEFLHAICFKEDVYLYYNPKNMLIFVYGTESMSKLRFIFMSLLPNVVFGFIPYLLFLLHPGWLLCGLVGAFCTGMGFGDYINVFNAATQMPKGAKTFLYGFHSYWYMENR